jgi:hypothetical protein
VNLSPFEHIGDYEAQFRAAKGEAADWDCALVDVVSPVQRDEGQVESGLKMSGSDSGSIFVPERTAMKLCPSPVSRFLLGKVATLTGL